MIITIARQCGCNGDELGKALAQKYNLKLFDKKAISKMAKEKGYFKDAGLDVDIKLPIRRMTWIEAMNRFGSDKPDLRFGMELKDISEVVKGCGFGVFTGALENGGSVRGINRSYTAKKNFQ